MKHISVPALTGLALAGGVLVYLTELVLQTRGGIVFIPPVSLPITLVVLAVAVVLLALPVRRVVTGKRREPIDPFYAARVLAFAKSSAYVGALLLGASLGLGLYLLVGRPLLPGWDVLGVALGCVVSCVLLLVAGIVAERLCTLPPPGDAPRDSPDGEPGVGAAA
jgi:hypothetical protein